MPYKPLKPCAIRSCSGRATHGRYCAAHAHLATRPPDDRPSAAARGYDRKWRRVRAQYLKRHSDCVVCGAPAEEVDHITPLSAGGTHAWENLQAMCKAHHSQKTASRDGGFGHSRVGGIEKSGGST